MTRYNFLFLLIIQCCACSVSYLDSGHFIPASNEPVLTHFLMEENLILIKAEVNGVSGTFLLDNGFSLSGLDPAFARKAKIKFRGMESLRDANNKRLETPKARVDTVRIQGQTFVNTGFYEIETSRFFPCYPIDGVIGASIMNKANWELDFQTQQLKISSNPFDNQGLKWDIEFSNNNSSFVKLSFQGQTARAKIDLGRSGGIKLDLNHFWEGFSGEEVVKRIGMLSLSATGFGAVDTTYLVHTPTQVKHAAEVLPFDARVGLYHQLKYPAYIGLGYLKQYHLTINSTTRQYILSPVEDDKKEMYSYGLSIYQLDGQWRVIQLIPNDPVLKSIKLMDEVSMLDGEPISRFTDICAYKNYLENKAEKKEPLSMVLKGSGERIELPYRLSKTMSFP